MEILTWDGSPITRAGLYHNVPMDAYHGAVTAKPSVSSTHLRKIESDSLAHMWDGYYLNPEREAEEDSDHFAIGRALHDLTAGQESFLDNYAIRPDEWGSWRTKDAKAWRADMELAGKTVLTPDDLLALQAMTRRLAKHPTIEAGILNGLIEHSIFWPDPATGIWLKARPDIVPLDSNMIVDLKTCASAAPRSVRRSITDFNYHMQLALAYEGLLMTTGREMTDFVLVFVETKRPHCVNIKPIFEDDIELGRRQLRRALDKFATALDAWQAGGDPDHCFAGYDDDEVPAGLDDYYRKRLAEEDKRGELPPL